MFTIHFRHKRKSLQIVYQRSIRRVYDLTVAAKTNTRHVLPVTAGLHRRDDRPFGLGSDDYRIIPGNAQANELVMSHVSTNFDRTGFQQDLNMVFPLDRLREMAEGGEISSIATYHYSFMGATKPEKMESAFQNWLQ